MTTTPDEDNSTLNFLISKQIFTSKRLPSLYCDLSVQRNSRPVGFAANCSAWISALVALALARKLPDESLFVVGINAELLNGLTSTTYGRPTGLEYVIREGMKEEKIIGVKEFVEMEGSLYKRNRSWRVPSIAEVVRWGFRQVGLVGEEVPRGEEVVLIQALEEVAKKVGRTMEGRAGGRLTGRIWSREEFGREVERLLGIGDGARIKKQDMEVLLRYLHRDTGVLSYNASTVKFSATFGKETPEPISTEDESIANLQLLIRNLSAQIEALETQKSTMRTKAVNAVKQKNKHSAMAALRSKASATKQLEQRTATLQQLEEVYAQIENAADQVSVVETLKSSAGVLKSLNKKVGDVSEVENVLDGLREEMQKTSEVQGVLAEPLAEDSSFVEAEVDEEFEAMEREERETREKEEAEKTRKRLEQLDQGVPVVEEKTVSKTEGVDIDEELAKSVEGLEGMSLEGRRNGDEKEGQQRQDDRVAA